MTGPLDLRGGGGPAQIAVAPLAEILPWFAHDALIHYLAPRGLEQYSGGGWGTRDVCQGPVELLLALGRTAPVRDLLLRVFRNQNPDGDWPQWFMFFERERGIRPGDSHGDIVFWPLLALAQYLLASDDAGAARRGACRSSIPRATRARERATRARARRARARADRAARDPGHAARGLRPRRLERLAPARRPRARRASCAARGRSRSTTRRSTTLAAALRRVGPRRRSPTQLEAAAAADPRRLPAPARRGRRRRRPRALPRGRRDRALAAPARPRARASRYSLLPMIHAILADLFTPEQAAAPRRADPPPPARGRRRAPVRPAAAVPRRPAAPLPARGDQHVLRPRDRPHVHARPPALCGGDGAPGRRRGVLPRAAPGESDRICATSCRTRGCARRTATRRAPTRTSRIATEAAARYDDGADGRRRRRGRLARLLERRGHRGAARARVPARPAPAALGARASTRCCRARSTACARRVEIAGSRGRAALPRRRARVRAEARCVLNGAELAFERAAQSVPRGRRARRDGGAARAACATAPTSSLVELG